MPSHIVDGHMASHLHHYHHRRFPRFVQSNFETRGLCTVLLPIGWVYTNRCKHYNLAVVWNLVLIKIQPPCPTPLAPREMLRWVWGFLVSMKAIGLRARAACDEAVCGGNDGEWIRRESGGVKGLATPIS